MYHFSVLWFCHTKKGIYFQAFYTSFHELLISLEGFAWKFLVYSRRVETVGKVKGKSPMLTMFSKQFKTEVSLKYVHVCVLSPRNDNDLFFLAVYQYQSLKIILMQHEFFPFWTHREILIIPMLSNTPFIINITYRNYQLVIADSGDITIVC